MSLNKSPSTTTLVWLKSKPKAPNLMPRRVKWNNFLIKVWWITEEGSASVMKETMVKQTVKVNPAEEHPGVSEKFFFWLNQANRSRQSCKPFEFGLWRAQFTGNLKSNFVIFLMVYAVFSGTVKLPLIWESSVLDPFPLTINGLHLLHTTVQVNRCPHID